MSDFGVSKPPENIDFNALLKKKAQNKFHRNTYQTSNFQRHEQPLKNPVPSKLGQTSQAIGVAFRHHGCRVTEAGQAARRSKITSPQRPARTDRCAGCASSGE